MPRSTRSKSRGRGRQKPQAKQTHRARTTHRRRLRGGLIKRNTRIPGSRAIQGAYALHQYANQGPEGRAAATAELLEHILSNPKVQDQLAQVAAEGTGIALKVAGDVVPQLLDTAQKVSGKAESAGTNLIEGVLDIIPVVDQIEGIAQGLLAVDRGVAAATQTGVGVVKAATATVNDLGETAADFQQSVGALTSTADQAIKSDVNLSQMQPNITAPEIPVPQLPKMDPSPPRPPRPSRPTTAPTTSPQRTRKASATPTAKKTRKQRGGRRHRPQRRS